MNKTGGYDHDSETSRSFRSSSRLRGGLGQACTVRLRQELSGSAVLQAQGSGTHWAGAIALPILVLASVVATVMVYQVLPTVVEVRIVWPQGGAVLPNSPRQGAMYFTVRGTSKGLRTIDSLALLLSARVPGEHRNPWIYLPRVVPDNTGDWSYEIPVAPVDDAQRPWPGDQVEIRALVVEASDIPDVPGTEEGWRQNETPDVVEPDIKHQSQDVIIWITGSLSVDVVP